MFENDNVKVSVIVPVYHTEALVEKCLDSILNQTYRNIEVLVIDDGSNNGLDNIVALINDDRVRLIKHGCNKGLLRARTTGMRNATGDYFIFVDSDDMIGIDFIRLLLKRAQEDKVDIVVGNTVFVEENGEEKVSCLHRAAFNNICLNDFEVREHYFTQEGRCHSWHNVWNKIYSKRLIDKCIDYIDSISSHIIMGEDILLSSLFMYWARGLRQEINANYFYFRRGESSVGESTQSIEKFDKNVNDLKLVFDYVDDYLVKEKADENILSHFRHFRQRYAKIWLDMAQNLKAESGCEDVDKSLEQLCSDIPDKIEDTDYFGLFERPWGNGVENIKRSIMSDKYSYISFDVFDTAVIRPFGKPEDLFNLLNKTFEAKMRCNISFSRLRINAEQGLRQKIANSEDNREDVTLEEIYEYMSTNYNISSEICGFMLQKEIELEIQYVYPRKIIEEFFDVAKICGKRVIFVTDMYLGKSCIEQILHKCGYEDYDNIFVSAEYGVLKSSGKLYDKVLSELNIGPEQMLHIGDNEQGDIKCALEKGIDAYFVPKVWDLFINDGYRYPAGNRLNAIIDASGVLVNKDKVIDNCAIRSMMALAAGRMFDNPFVRYDNTSNYEYDPYYIGYYSLGTHLVSVLKWMADTSRDRGYRRIIYTSRDGWLYMQAHKIWSKYNKTLPDAKYIYVSRHAMLPAMIINSVDLYNLPIEVTQYTPDMLYNLLSFCADDSKEKQLWKHVKTIGLKRNIRFVNNDEYNAFIQSFIKVSYCEEKLISEQVKINEYMKFLRKQDAIFDMGYSGRIHKAIVDMTGKPVDALFIHKDTKLYEENARKGGFRIDSFLKLSPLMPDLLREHIISESGKSCIGYEYQGDKVVPKFEVSEKKYCDKFVIDKLHKGALDFVEDFLKYFGDYMDYMAFKPDETALILEGFLSSSLAGDRHLFLYSYFEDNVYSGNPRNNVAEYINEKFRIMSCIKNR